MLPPCSRVPFLQPPRTRPWLREPSPGLTLRPFQPHPYLVSEPLTLPEASPAAAPAHRSHPGSRCLLGRDKPPQAQGRTPPLLSRSWFRGQTLEGARWGGFPCRPVAWAVAASPQMASSPSCLAPGPWPPCRPGLLTGRPGRRGPSCSWSPRVGFQSKQECWSSEAPGSHLCRILLVRLQTPGHWGVKAFSVGGEARGHLCLDLVMVPETCLLLALCFPAPPRMPAAQGSLCFWGLNPHQENNAGGPQVSVSVSRGSQPGQLWALGVHTASRGQGDRGARAGEAEGL